MDEETFLCAISASPADVTLRLAYADWLEERGDARAEFVRLQVQLRELPENASSRIQLEKREEELRSLFPPRWSARLDPPVWCAVGNIVEVRHAAEGETPLRGTRLFRPNAKVILATISNCYFLLNPEELRSESVQVIGQHRKSRKWIESWVKLGATRNWRLRLVSDPGAKIRLRKAGWFGCLLRENEFQFDGERDSIEALRALFDAMYAAVRRPQSE